MKQKILSKKQSNNDSEETSEGAHGLNNTNLQVRKGDKVIFLGANDLAKTTLFQILNGEMEADSGSFSWGVTTTRSYFPTDNSHYFEDGKYNLVDWLRQYSTDKDETIDLSSLSFDESLFGKEVTFVFCFIRLNFF